MEDAIASIPPKGSTIIRGRIALPYEPGRLEKAVTIRVTGSFHEKLLVARIGALVLPRDLNRAIPASIDYHGEASDGIVERLFTIPGLDCDAELDCVLDGLAGIASIEVVECNSEIMTGNSERTVRVLVNFSLCDAGQHFGSVTCRCEGQSDIVVPVRVEFRPRIDGVKDRVIVRGLGSGETRRIHLLDENDRADRLVAELTKPLSKGTLASIDHSSMSVELTREANSSAETTSVFVVELRDVDTQAFKRIPIIVMPADDEEQQ